ncbi:MAG: AraC family transcriptional regulator [Bacteroidota bacterium]
MILGFYYKNGLLFFFCLQGLIFAYLLVRKGIKHDNAPSKWLSLFVFLCSLYLMPWMFGHANWYAKDGFRDFLFFAPLHQLFLLGPVIYAYTRALLNPNFSLKGQEWWHFAPAIAYGLYSLVVFITDVFILDQYWFYADGRDKDLAPWYQICGLISMVTYAGLSVRYYFRYRRLAVQELSYADSVRFSWIKRYLIVFLFVLLLRLSFLIILPEWGSFGLKFWYYLCFAILTYYIALEGYTNTVESLVPVRDSGLDFHAGSRSPVNATEHLVSPPVKEDSSVKLARVTTQKQALEQLMQEQALYRNPTLTLTEVAQALGTHSRQVSRLINQGFAMNFNDYVNQYRVAAVKDSFQRGEQTERTLLGIALDCGFNSKTTFNRVFKKVTGQTPLKYLNTLDARKSNIES